MKKNFLSKKTIFIFLAIIMQSNFTIHSSTTPTTHSSETKDAIFYEVINILSNGYVVSQSTKREEERISAVGKFIHSIIRLFRIIKRNKRSFSPEEKKLLQQLRDISQDPCVMQELDKVLLNDQLRTHFPALHSEQVKTD